jgi:hypothetical protein
MRLLLDESLAATRLDALVTVGKNMPFQQNASTLPLPVFVLDSVSSEIVFLLPLLPDFEAAMPGSIERRFYVIRCDA